MRERSTQAFANEQSQQKLRESVSIVDARSLFDHLSKETLRTTDDKRCAIEMQIIRQSLSESNT